MPKKSYEEKKEMSLLRFGESYTSLILGMIVVIISTVLLLAFVHNKNASKTTTADAQPTAKMSSDFIAANNPKVVSPTSEPTATPTVKPVKVVKTTAVPTVVEKKSPTPTPKKAVVTVVKTDKKGAYVVKKGDTLWSRAEREYKSGYKWVDIARVNKLNNPNVIEAGSRLVLPKVATKVVAKATVTTKDEQYNKTSRKVEQKKSAMKQAPVQAQKITGTTYTVVRGDNLWDISVRAYGDGYQWVKIAKANNLANPSIIHRGNKFVIPRGK